MQEVFGLIIEQVEMASSALIQILDSDNLAPHATRLAMMEVAGKLDSWIATPRAVPYFIIPYRALYLRGLAVYHDRLDMS